MNKSVTWSIGPFSCTAELHTSHHTERRWWRWFLERREYGFDEREMWDLSSVFSDFIRPRLEMYLNVAPTRPNGVEAREWVDMLSDMIYAFDTRLDWAKMKKKDFKRRRRGRLLFAKYFNEFGW